VYQYDGESPHRFSPSLLGSDCCPVGQWAPCTILDLHRYPSTSIVWILTDISPEIKAKRRIFEIINIVQSDNPQTFATKPAFDGKKNIFSFKPLFPDGGGGVYPCKPEGARDEYTVTIRLVAQVESEC
jgi:hypothetical protein